MMPFWNEASYAPAVAQGATVANASTVSTKMTASTFERVHMCLQILELPKVMKGL
jgi:hypothetical protein